jgi:hypothetical protein
LAWARLLSQQPLQRFLGGMRNIPRRSVAGDRRAWEVIFPPALDQLVDRIGWRLNRPVFVSYALLR